MTDLQSLIARLKAATFGYRDLDFDIHIALVGLENAPKLTSQYPNYTTSIDAALTLVPEGWAWAVGNCGEKDAPWACVTSPLDGDEVCEAKDYSASASTPPIALCIAALRAKAAQGEG